MVNIRRTVRDAILRGPPASRIFSDNEDSVRCGSINSTRDRTSETSCFACGGSESTTLSDQLLIESVNVPLPFLYEVVGRGANEVGEEEEEGLTPAPCRYA